jgi:hypothetical protein
MSAGQLCEFYQAYVYGTLDSYLMPRAEFIGLVRSGKLICSMVCVRGVAVLAWGMELCADDEGRPYLQFLFMVGRAPRLVLKKVVVEGDRIARACGALDRQWRARVKVNGRRGWRRKVREIGVRLTAEGWVIHDQFGHFFHEVGQWAVARNPDHRE